MTAPITPEEAMLDGFVSITSPYRDHEKELLRRALLTMTGCNVALVRVAHGTEIWRKKTEIRTEVEELSAADVKKKQGGKR